MVLVEKEWVSFGHQFALRANIVDPKKGTNNEDDSEELDIFKNVTQFLSETTKGRQDGPIFQQFLDCVYQLLYVFPNMFEFNERFLRRLLYHSYACQYGTFLFNTEKDLLAQDTPHRARSVWDYFFARRTQFVNSQYEKPNGNEEVLIIPTEWKPRWWAGSFGRIDSDMNNPNAWRERPVKKPTSGEQYQRHHSQNSQQNVPQIQQLSITDKSHLGSKKCGPIASMSATQDSIASCNDPEQTLKSQSDISPLLGTNGSSKLSAPSGSISIVGESGNHAGIAG